jgi:hypothetical protein
VQYLVGPDKGVFEIAEVESSAGTTIVFEHPADRVDCHSPDYGVAWVDVALPPMNDPSRNRSFVLRGVAGDCVVYRVNAGRDVPGGISVSEMAIGGVGYTAQTDVTVTPRESWKAYVAAYMPDIVIWQYANNQGAATIVEATMELMDRVDEVNPDVIHIITPDHPTPRDDWQEVVNSSLIWAEALRGYHGAIVINPTPYLPSDFLSLAGTGLRGLYFNNTVHENPLGARTVVDAMWQALEAQLYPQPSYLSAPNPDNTALSNRRGP